MLPNALTETRNAKVFIDLSCSDPMLSRVTEGIKAFERVTDER
jgi:hypothetical protein